MLNIESLIQELTLEEKASLCSGADQWHTTGVKRLGIPQLRLSDGPNGLRFIENGKAKPAVSFPTGSAMAASFDTELIKEIGSALGDTARSFGVHTVLGPAVNMKRSPLCGRNFEYLSEDPYVAGEIGAALTAGIQSRGVGACPKHFAVNNQEHRRMSVSAQVDDRTLREIYLTAFEKIVKQASPHMMMCAYNRVNGTYSSENEYLLNEILRREWGFEGIVVTDWAAMNRRPRALRAGLELEMPSSFGQNDALIVNAVKSGELPEEVLDEAVRRILTWIDKELEGSAKEYENVADEQKLRELARRAAASCAVLLKNEDILPLKKGSKVAFIGGFAKHPRFQGGGSSHVNSTCVSALESASRYENITFAEGYSVDDDRIDEAMIQEAVRCAREAEVAVIFAGLPDAYESEGVDRATLAMPENQNRLIEEVCGVQPKTVVVFHAGSPVDMPWRHKVGALLYMYLGGVEVGNAAVDLLYGDVNPSGRLAETFPLRLEDTPCFLDFPGTEDEVNYTEGIYIGYRWYDKRRLPVAYPFGHGLSYTTFEYSNIQLSLDQITDQESLRVSLDVTNTGSLAGSEVIQLYVAPPKDTKLSRPLKELKGFSKLYLEPGERATVTFTLDKRSFAVYSRRVFGWYVETGQYTIMVGASSANLPLSKCVTVQSTDKVPVVYTDHMTVSDLRSSGLDVSEAMELIGVRDLDMGAVGLGTKVDRETHLEIVKNGMPIHAMVSIEHRDMKAIYDALRKVEGLLGKETIPDLK